MPCPNGVNIPQNFAIYNEAHMWNDMRSGQMRYQGQSPQGGLTETQRANQCLECGECMEACPQKIEIPDQLKKAHALLAAKP